MIKIKHLSHAGWSGWQYLSEMPTNALSNSGLGAVEHAAGVTRCVCGTSVLEPQTCGPVAKPGSRERPRPYPDPV